MAVRFRITDAARGRMETIRAIMQRRAAWVMSGVVTGAALMLWITKVFIAAPPQTEFEVYDQGDEMEVNDTQRETKDISGGAPPVTPPVVDVIVAQTDVVMDTFPAMDLDLSNDDLSEGPLGSMGDGDGLGDGVGSGNSNGGMGGGKLESGFAGVFYDFKKKNDGKDSPLAGKSVYFNGDVLQIESRFVNKMWDLSIFAPYFRPKMQLYTSCFYQPNCQDREACNAFDPENRYNMRPGRWVAVYRARVQAPVTGRFRFVGVADSLMAVRFDGKNVLFCGLHDVENNKWNEWSLLANPGQKSARELYAYKNCDAWNMQVGGFTPGKEFSVKEGQWYEMQVLVSEIGGGDYGFCLLIDDMDKPNKQRTPEGQPIFQLFRTAFSAPSAEAAYKTIKYKDESNITDPPYDPDSSIWMAKPLGPEVKMK